MAEQTPKSGNIFKRAAEKTAGFFEKLHYFIGGAAVGGFAAEELTGIAPEPNTLLAVGVIEGLHGLLVGGVKNALFKEKGKRQASKLGGVALAGA